MHRPIPILFIPTILCLTLGSSGCEVLGSASSNSSCVTHSDDYGTELETEGKLAESVAEESPYPMAMVISQAALNTLFAAIAAVELPPITLLEDPLGFPISMTIHPEFPLIQVGGDLGCGECLLTELGFGLTLGFSGVEGTGHGAGRFQFPVTLNPNGMESTKVLAELGSSALVSFDLQVDGIDDSILDAVEPFISTAITLVVQESFGDTELFEMGAWTMGDGDVALLARGPIIDPVAETVVLGIHTNLIRPLSGAVELDTSLPAGIDIGMQFHPELIQTMVQRMMHEGHISRTYDELGTEDANGNHKVTLNFMQASENELLRTNFRLWRTGGGFCGFADLQADLGLSISDREIALDVENIAVTEGAGAGELLVAADSWYQSAFTEDMMHFSELTINYRELALPEGKSADMSAESFRLEIDGSGLSVFLNIDGIVDAD